MGLRAVVADVLEFLRRQADDGHVTDVKVDPGDGDVFVAQHSSPPGEDSFPLTTDQAVAVALVGSNRRVAVAYLDPQNEPLATEGEKRFYSRDPGDDGAIKATVWLRADGSIELVGEVVHLGEAPGAAPIPRDDHLQTELGRIKSELDALKADIQSVVTAISAGAPSPMDGGAGLKATIVAALSGVPAAAPQDPGETACEKVTGT